MARNQKWREEFIARMSREGLPLGTIRAVLRYSATLQRLAEAQCNGEWPYNGDRDRPSPAGQRQREWDKRYLVCPRCEQLCAKWVMRKDHTVPKLRPESGSGFLIPLKCPDCRTADLLRAALEGSGWAPIFQGDPRGCVVKLARACICHKSCGGCGITTHAEHPANPECLTHGTQGQEAIQNGRAESRGDVIGVPS